MEEKKEKKTEKDETEEEAVEVLEMKRKSLIGIYGDYVAVCISTTGINPRKNNLIEIGAVRVRGGEITEKFDELINPGHKLDDRTIKFTGLTNAMLREAPHIEEILPEFDAFLGDAILLGNNMPFDLGFFQENYMRVLKKPFPNSYIDTMKVSKNLYSGYQKHRLEDLKLRYMIPEHEEYPAVQDAIDTHLCYQCMVEDMKENEKEKEK